VAASSSPSRSAAAELTRDELERQRRDLNDQAAELKWRIRHDREQLQSVATMRRELIEQIEQFGIEVVIVAPLETEQGVERNKSHGRHEEAESLEEAEGLEEATADRRHTTTTADS
jgi:ribosomal protein S24E